MWYILTKLQCSSAVERKQNDSQKTEIISWVVSECENIKFSLWKLWSVSCSGINGSLTLTERNWISTWWETSSILRNTVSALILFSFLLPLPSFHFRVNGKLVALKVIRLQEEEGTPFTAIREGMHSHLMIIPGGFFCNYIGLLNSVPCYSQWLENSNYICLSREKLRSFKNKASGVWVLVKECSSASALALVRFTRKISRYLRACLRWVSGVTPEDEGTV